MQQLLRKERCFRQLRRALLSLTLVLGCGSLATGQTPLPEGKGKEMVEAACTQCHGLRETTSARRAVSFGRNFWSRQVTGWIRFFVA